MRLPHEVELGSEILVLIRLSTEQNSEHFARVAAWGLVCRVEVGPDRAWTTAVEFNGHLVV
jgi:hypothetical protein